MNEGPERSDPRARTAQHSIVAARRLTMNLLEMRPPGASVADVLTLVGFDDDSAEPNGRHAADGH